MIDKFLEFEEKNGLLDDAIEGFHYWFFIRDKVYNAIIGVTNDSRVDSKTIVGRINKTVGSDDLSNTGLKIGLRSITRLIFNITVPKYLFKSPKSVLIFTSPRRVKEGNSYKSIYTDFINDHFSGRCITAEFPNGIAHLHPAYSNPIVEMDRIDFIPFIKGEIIRRFSKHFKAEFEKRGKLIADALCIEFGKDFEAATIAKMIEMRYYWFKYKKPMLQRFIKRVNPAVIVEIGGYGRNTLIVNEIAKELGIPTIELQHGIIGAGHIGYNYCSVDRRYKNLPQYLCVFSQYWKDTCRFPIGTDNIFVTGFPYFDRARNKYKTKPAGLSEKNQSIINIVILSQPVCREEIIDYCKELLSVLPNETFQFHYKLHPLEYNYKAQIEKCFAEFSNISVYDGSSFSLYDLFDLCCIQIGAFSTSLYEGLGFGLKTLILGIGNSEERMQDIISRNQAILVNNADEAASILKSFNVLETDAVDAEYFFKSGAEDTIIDLIESFL